MDPILVVVVIVIVVVAAIFLVSRARRTRGEVPPSADWIGSPPEPPATRGSSSPTAPTRPLGIPPPQTAPGVRPEVRQPPPSTTERGASQELIDRLREAEDTRAAPPIGTFGPPRPAEDVPRPIEFSSYAPKEVKPNDWQPLVAYVFRENAADAVAADAKQQLGDRLAAFRETVEPARQAIAEGATIKAEPTLEGFQFNPPSVTVGLFEDWHRFDFKLRAHSAPVDLAANGRLTFTVEGVIVADLPLSIYVGETAAASATTTARAKPYSAVFCSYSRKDIAIVQRVEMAYRALGMKYMRDMISIRSGEDWSDALKALMTEADIFQLFWSSHSSTSNHVRMEWEFALKLAETRDHFIRPVYWETPMPPVPEVMSMLHFAYEPDLGA